MKKNSLTLSFILFNFILVFSQAPKKVIVEDFTGAGCSHCPIGISTLANILTTYPNAIGIANHAYPNGGGDAMFNPYVQAVGSLTCCFPSGMIDRHIFPLEGNIYCFAASWTGYTAQRLQTTSPVAIDIISTYNNNTRVATATVNANFVGNATGNMRINCIIVEDSVTSATGGPGYYTQHNTYGQGCPNADVNSTWYNYPCFIPNFVHDHVARANMADSTFGTAGVIPFNVTAGSSYTKTYSYTLPNTWRSDFISLVAFVSFDIDSFAIMNANKVALGSSVFTGVENSQSVSMEIKPNTPNPFTDITSISFKLNKTDQISIKVYNAYGQLVNEIINSKLISGEHTFYWS